MVPEEGDDAIDSCKARGGKIIIVNGKKKCVPKDDPKDEPPTDYPTDQPTEEPTTYSPQTDYQEPMGTDYRNYA
ncbi:MAG: hypothetical protein H0U18_17760 [Pyrinomonadaceae bacterium]|nr:hypothetical protein [Pyrinomonadaceae bacterium]